MARLAAVSEVSHESCARRLPCVFLHDRIRMERMIRGSALGILGPILLVLLGLWLARGGRSPGYLKAILLAALAALLLVMFGYL